MSKAPPPDRSGPAEAPSPAREGGILLAQVHQLGGRRFSRILQRHGIRDLNPAQGRIVYALWREDGLTQAQLAARTRLDKSTLTLMLQRLEAAGQVQRRPAPADSRLRRVHLTERNRALHQAYREASEEMVALYYRGFTGPEIQAFEAALRRILDNLDHPAWPETADDPT
jgi:DNA-binding MarR family transcriptional regulator